jgi:carbon monoxide dehydrogenase subunit G
LQGKALTVDQKGNYTWIHMRAVVRGKSSTELIFVELQPKQTSILKDECYRFYGTVKGTQKITITLTGATTEVPVASAYAYEKAPADRFGNCTEP